MQQGCACLLAPSLGHVHMAPAEFVKFAQCYAQSFALIKRFFLRVYPNHPMALGVRTFAHVNVLTRCTGGPAVQRQGRAGRVKAEAGRGGVGVDGAARAMRQCASPPIGFIAPDLQHEGQATVARDLCSAARSAGRKGESSSPATTPPPACCRCRTCSMGRAASGRTPGALGAEASRSATQAPNVLRHGEWRGWLLPRHRRFRAPCAPTPVRDPQPVGYRLPPSAAWHSAWPRLPPACAAAWR